MNIEEIEGGGKHRSRAKKPPKKPVKKPAKKPAKCEICKKLRDGK